MTIKAWRIFKQEHAKTAFTGEGAKLFRGRWNCQGTAVVYTAGSISLAVLEMLVHLRPNELQKSYRFSAVTFAEALVEQIRLSDLPPNWRDDPAPAELQRLGDAWIKRSSSAVLRVPSAIVPAEFNYLLNPAHPEFLKIRRGRSQPLRFDARLFRRRD